LWQCPADHRSELVTPLEFAAGYNVPVAFTAYLGVSGISGDLQGGREGVLAFNATRRMADITDGTSNTLLVGERPPSADLFFGWWFAGAGYDEIVGGSETDRQSSGTGDVVLGARETRYAASMGCPAGKVGLQPGKLTEKCDQVHFWSMHAGGANFVLADGSVRFLSYSADAVLPALCTRNGGETVGDY
jgi:prepilin-type processing-associated H-X9-DG protein